MEFKFSDMDWSQIFKWKNRDEISVSTNSNPEQKIAKVDLVYKSYFQKISFYNRAGDRIMENGK